VPRVRPENPVVTIAPPTPAPDVEDPALKAVDAAARRAAIAREFDAKSGDPYHSQYAPTGDFESAHSFFRDLLVIAESDARAKDTLDRALSEGGLGGFDPGDESPPPGAFVGDDVASARERITRALARAKKVEENRAWFERARSEKRDLTSASTPDFMRPFGVPEWLADAFGRTSRQRGTLASVFRREPLLPGMAHDNGSGQLVLRTVPRFSGGAAVSIQASQNSAVQETDPTTANLPAFPVGTLAGHVDLSRQLFDLSRPGMDEGIAEDLGSDYGTKLDVQLVNGSGSSGQLRGFLNISGILSVTGDVSTAAAFQASIWKAYSALAGTSGVGVPAADEFVTILAPRRYAWARGSTTGIAAQALFPGEVAISGGIPTNLGGGTNEDVPLVVHRDSVVFVSQEPRVAVYPEVGSGTLTVRVSSHGFASLVVFNGAGVAKVTGLTPPSGF
jgi:hypothetical protein